MHVHVVRSEPVWILNKVSQSIQIPGITVGDKPNPKADINFYVAYHAFSGRVQGTLNVPWMTHLPNQKDDGGFRRKRFNTAAKNADYCIAMSKQTALSCPPGKTAIWGGAPDARFVKREIVLGVAAKISRRKCPEKIEALKAVPGVKVVVTDGKVPEHAMPAWYKAIDYLVITSDTEGGPYPVLEAIAAGVPVIAPNVGWCWEYPCIPYDGTTEDLVRLVSKLRFPEDPWKEASAKLWQIFKRMVRKETFT